MNCLGRVILIVVITIAVLVIVPLHFTFTLLLGWIVYLARVLPEVRVNGSAVIMAGICLVGIVLTGHLLTRWLWRETTGDKAKPWKLRWTISGLLIVVVGFASGIAATGMTRQAGWLLSDDRPLLTWDRPAHQIKCSSDLRQLGQLLEEYAAEHGGALPNRLEEVATTEYEHAWLSCPGPEGGPYVYRGRGLRLPLNPGYALITEPLSYHQGRAMNVLLGDLSVETFLAGEMDQVRTAVEAQPAMPSPRRAE